MTNKINRFRLKFATYASGKLPMSPHKQVVFYKKSVM